MNRATLLALTWLASTAGHDVGDYLVQVDRDAQAKQQRSRAGRFALARHVVTYGMAQATLKAITYRAAGVRVPVRALAVGQVVEVVLHAIIDDGRLLRRFEAASGKQRFHDLNAGGVNGRMLMDQACHRGLQVPLAAVVTCLLVPSGVRSSDA